MNQVNPANASGKIYKNILTQIENVGVCPFCPKHFRWHNRPILKKHNLWFITNNFNPYKNSRFHFLIIGKVHKEEYKQIEVNDLISIDYLVKWATKKYKIKGAALCIRYGDIAYTGASVNHLHAHLIVPNIKEGKALVVNFPIG